MDDRELLEAYARDRSEADFEELVRRHLPWVYSVALRHSGNPVLAEDVAQSVFVLLARKAAGLSSKSILGGWLFKTTRFMANHALRAERRRKSREEAAAAMSEPATFPNAFANENEAVWKQLEPCLDQAVAALSEADRAAVLMRFYERKSLLEVGRRLGLSEEAAKKRVSRALQKMKAFLARRGVTVGATVLIGLMAEQVVQAVPAGLAASVMKTAMAGPSAAGALPKLAEETLRAWRWTKFKFAVGLGVSVFGLVWVTLLVTTHRNAIPTAQRDVEAERPSAGQSAKVLAGLPTRPASSSKIRKSSVIHFRVVAKDSGEPVTGASLAVNYVVGRSWEKRFDFATDGNGGVDISYPADTMRLDVGVVASGWGARFVTWQMNSDPEIPAEYILRVERSTNFMGGWLLDEKDQPVADAVIEMEFGTSDMAQQENPRERPGFVTPAPVARSDQRGWWGCAVMGADAKRFPGLRARHPDFAPTEIMPASPVGAEQAQSPTMQLLRDGKLKTLMNRGIKLAGRIMTEEGQALPGSQVEHEPGSSEPVRTESDGLGWFAVPGLPPGPFDFIVTAPGFAQTYFKVNISEGMAPVEVRLKPGGILRIRVVDEDGNGVSGGTVALTGPGGMYVPGMNWSAQTGPDGRVEWTSAPTNNLLNICASRYPDFAVSRGTLVKANGEEHLIKLRRVLVVTGRVIDARTEEPVQGEIKAYPGYGQGEYSWFRGDTRRSSDGTFKVYFSEGRSPCRFRIDVEGYSSFVSDWLQPDTSRVVDLRLQPADPAKTVRGTVWKPNGQPAAGAEVALLTPEHSAMLGRARFAERAAVDRLILNTDDSGNFAFPEEPNARFVVAVCRDGFARLPMGDERSALQVHLQPWGRIEGLIDASARERTITHVMVDDLLSLNSPGGMRLDSQTFSAKPTEDGRFTFEFLPQGLLAVWLRSDPGEDPTIPPFHHLNWIQVPAGETAELKIAETGYRVKGRLVLNGLAGEVGKQPAYASLEGDWPPELANPAWLTTKQWIRSFVDPGRLLINPDGTFESRNSISPGSYRILGRIAGAHIDQPIEVPNPAENELANPNSVFGGETRVIDLGEIAVLRN